MRDKKFTEKAGHYPYLDDPLLYKKEEEPEIIKARSIAAKRFYSSLNSVELRDGEGHGRQYSSIDTERPYTRKSLITRTSNRVKELCEFIEEIKARKNDPGLVRLVQSTLDINLLLLQTLQGEISSS